MELTIVLLRSSALSDPEWPFGKQSLCCSSCRRPPVFCTTLFVISDSEEKCLVGTGTERKKQLYLNCISLVKILSWPSCRLFLSNQGKYRKENCHKSYQVLYYIRSAYYTELTITTTEIISHYGKVPKTSRRGLNDSIFKLWK